MRKIRYVIEAMSISFALTACGGASPTTVDAPQNDVTASADTTDIVQNSETVAELGGIESATISFDTLTYEYADPELEKLIHGKYTLEVAKNGEGATVDIKVDDRYGEIHKYSENTDASALTDLAKIIAEHEMQKLDGYNKTDSASGEGFELKVVYDSGSKISASAQGGHSAMPVRYWDETVFLKYMEKLLALNGESLILLPDKTEDDDYGEIEEAYPKYMIENPSWEYYCTDGRQPASKHVKLVPYKSEANEIIDDDVWFGYIGEEKPDVNSRSDDDYTYNFYGGEYYSGHVLEIDDKKTGETVAVLDMSEMFYPDNPASDEDLKFVDENLRHAVSENGILYVCMAHSTYAESASHNAYIMALDMNDEFRMVWKTEPLTCNAANFVIYGDDIICGYGFTAEPDYIYVLDKSTGARVDTIKVKTGPDYFYVKEGEILGLKVPILYVRTYDMNYEFMLQ